MTKRNRRAVKNRKNYNLINKNLILQNIEKDKIIFKQALNNFKLKRKKLISGVQNLPVLKKIIKEKEKNKMKNRLKNH